MEDHYEINYTYLKNNAYTTHLQLISGRDMLETNFEQQVHVVYRTFIQVQLVYGHDDLAQKVGRQKCNY